MGFYFFNELKKFFGGVSFDVEFGGNVGRQIQNVGVANVSFIGSWVYGNALCSKTLAVQRYLQYIGVVATSGISEGGNFVDIDREFGRRYFSHSATKIRG